MTTTCCLVICANFTVLKSGEKHLSVIHIIQNIYKNVEDFLFFINFYVSQLYLLKTFAKMC